VAQILGHARVSTMARYTLLAATDLRREHARTHPRGDGRPPADR